MLQRIKSILKKCKVINESFVRLKWRKKRVSYGRDNADKIFYVIRRATCKVGLFSHVMTNLGEIDYALKQGYIPIIDMENNENTYLERQLIGKVNAWEYYFKQPCGYSLDDIDKSKNIILGNGLITKRNIYPTEKITKDKADFLKWHKLSEHYLILQDDIEQEVSRLYNDMFGCDRVLGVLCRGTDYVRCRPQGHPIQPSVDEIIEKAREMKEKNHCRWVYLATEDENYYQAFLNSFGKNLKVTEARRCSQDGKFNINDISYGRENEKYLKGKDYLINIAILSRCNCLLAGAVGGTYGAMLLSKGYEAQYIFDLGLYE